LQLWHDAETVLTALKGGTDANHQKPFTCAVVGQSVVCIRHYPVIGELSGAKVAREIALECNPRSALPAPDA